MISRTSIQLIAVAIAIYQSATCTANQINYDGYSVFKCHPQSKAQVDFLLKLMNDGVQDGVKFWNEPNAINGTVDIMVSPQKAASILSQLRAWKIPTEKTMANIGAVIRRTNMNRSANRNHNFNGTRQSLDYFHLQYQSYEAIEAKLEQLAARNPMLRKEVAGNSFEQRPIYLVKISTNHNANKPVIFIDALHHAREWISAATAMHMIDSIVSDASLSARHKRPHYKQYKQSRYGRSLNQKQLNADIMSVLDRYDLWFVPVVNPDGYEYSRTTDRLWRKTRSSNSFCRGVDPNRNYRHHWRESGASSNPCSETYAGREPMSESETRTIANALNANRQRISMYISLHAFSQVLLTPYGYDQVYPPNYAELKRVATAGLGGFASLRGTRYRFGVSSILLYPAAGGSDDYAMGESGIPYAYTLELPDEGRYGFLLSPENIVPVGRETLAGIIAMIKEIPTSRRRSDVSAIASE